MMAILAVIYIVFISLGLPDSLFGVSWPILHVEMNVPENFASVCSVIIGICTGGASMVAGKLIRRFGTARVTLVSILVTAAGLLGISFSPNLVCLILASVILGYGAGAIDTGLNSYVSLHYKTQHMNWLHCFWGVGVTASPLIMSLFLRGDGASWRNGYRLIAFLEVLIACSVLFVLKKWNRIERESAVASQETADGGSGSIISLLRGKGVLISILSLGWYTSMEFTVGTWGATYLVNVFQLPPDHAARWVSFYYGGIMLGRLLSGFLAFRWKDAVLIRVGAVAAFAGIGILMLSSESLTIVGFLLIGMGFGPIFPSVLHSVPSRFGSAYAADLTGFHMSGAYLLGFLMQLLFGFVASATTFSLLPFFLALCCAGMLLCHEWVESRLKRKNR